MRALSCPACDLPVSFENDTCLACGTGIGFEPDTFSMRTADPWTMRRCANAGVAACNWVVPATAPGAMCRSCVLTRTRPADGDLDAQARFREAEAAKRRLVAQLIDLGLPIVSFEEHDEGLGFDLLSSRFDQVMIGHEDGLITLDLAETDDAYRERVRAELGEAYRTVLGHFRHEVGHYYWTVLVRDAGRLEEFRERFGDERADYGAALSTHYSVAPRLDWQDEFVSTYATMHPWEDWAETFAHYLHLRDTLQTAVEMGVRVTDPASAARAVPEPDVSRSPFHELVGEWITLAGVLNALNRSMGAADLYPFVLTATVIGKLEFVDRLIRGG